MDNFDNEKIYLRNAINCEEIKDEVEFKSDQEDDTLLKEIIEEEKQKREDFERERKRSVVSKEED